MTHDRPFDDDPSLDRAWQQFAADDAAASAPQHLEWRVLAAIRHAPPRDAAAPTRRLVPRVTWHMAAAAVLLSFALGMAIGRVMRPFAAPAQSVATPLRAPSPMPPLDHVSTPVVAAVDPKAAPAVAPPADDGALPAGSASDPDPGIGPPIAARLHFVTDPSRVTESLQLVRVRVPRALLPSLGLDPSDLADDAFVDVDVAIGEDGLPRDIRPVSPPKE